MKRFIVSLVLVAAFVTPVQGADLTVTVPANAVANATDMCERLRVELRVLAVNWSNDVCAAEFLRRGLRSYTLKEKRREISSTQNTEVSDEGNTFDVNFPLAFPKTYCGDGVVDAEFGEACDDGNNTDGDGCEADCTTP